MHARTSRVGLQRLLLPLAIAGGCLALVGVGPSVAFGTAATTAPEPPATNVVLTGSYGCQIVTTSYSSSPGGEPLVVRELAHAVSITGTGAAAANPPSGIGPAFGGVRGRPGPEIVPVSLGSGIGNGFDGGSLDDCVRFAEAVRSVAGVLGCAMSPMRTRQTDVLLLSPFVRFSFVCEGPAASQIHAIAELDRMVVSQRLGTE